MYSEWMRLFLDDERFPPRDGNEWAIVRSVREARHYCREHGVPSFISFDHDLGVEQGEDGQEFAKWLIEQDLDAPGFIPAGFDFYVHSANPAGAKNIEGLLRQYLTFRAS